MHRSTIVDLRQDSAPRSPRACGKAARQLGGARSQSRAEGRKPPRIPPARVEWTAEGPFGSFGIEHLAGSDQVRERRTGQCRSRGLKLRGLITGMCEPPHPGGIVQRQCLGPLGLSVTRAAKGFCVTKLALSKNRRRAHRDLSGDGDTAVEGVRLDTPDLARDADRS